MVEKCSSQIAVIRVLSKFVRSQIEIATNLQIDKSLISRDLAYLRQQAKSNIRRYLQGNKFIYLPDNERNASEQHSFCKTD